jgi:hypothetical protein
MNPKSEMQSISVELSTREQPQVETQKPNSEKVIAILDDALPKIKAFQNLSYPQAKELLNDDYFFKTWK